MTDFLDVTFDLPNGKYFPYRKSNNEPLYINAHSNHPPPIIKDLPIMVNGRVSEFSCDEEEFLKAKAPCEAAMKESGHQPVTEYAEPLSLVTAEGSVIVKYYGSIRRSAKMSRPTLESYFSTLYENALHGIITCSRYSTRTP